VSENDNCHCTGTTKVAVKSWEGTPEEKSLKATSENGHRGCGRDMLGQTVPSTGSSYKEVPSADGGQPCTTDIQRQWGSRSKASPGPEISRVQSSSARYDGVVPCRYLHARTASLKCILPGAVSQYSWRIIGVMWSYLDEENTSRAAEFITDLSCWKRFDGMPAI